MQATGPRRCRRRCRRRRLWPRLLPPHPSLAHPSHLLKEIAPFEEPKIELEQYPTGPHLASRLLYTARARRCFWLLARRGDGLPRDCRRLGPPGQTPYTLV